MIDMVLSARRHRTHDWWWPSFWRPEWSAPGARPPTRIGPDDDEPPPLPAPGSDTLPRVVHRGGPVGDVVWEITAFPDPYGPGLMTSVRRRRGELKAGSGMGGPHLDGGRSVDTWAGNADHFPPFVVVRTSPVVDDVAVHGLAGLTYPVALSSIDPDYAMRFGAAPLRSGDWPLTITVRTTGDETWTGPYFTPGR